MIFDNLPHFSDKDFGEIIMQRFRELRSAIFSILPDECLLRPKRVLINLIPLIDVNMISRRLVEREDICSFCPLKECPYNNVSDRKERIEKVVLIGKVARKFQ